MCRFTATVCPIGFSRPIAGVHFNGLPRIGNGVYKCYIDKEIAESIENLPPLFSGEPRPFKTVNLVLVSTHTLTDNLSLIHI